jgi:hypothetical protein
MSQMPNIEETDFRSLDSFPLKWRWTDSRWNKFLTDALNAIQPFSESKARELCQYSLGFSNQSGLTESLFDRLSRIDTPDDSREIRQWLLDRSSDLNQTVLYLETMSLPLW